MPWADVAANVRLPLRLAGNDDPTAVAQALDRVGLKNFAQSYPSRIIGRHEDARLDCARPGDRAAIDPDGRTFCGA